MSLPITIYGARAAGLESGSITLLGSPSSRNIDDGLVGHWSATLQGGIGSTFVDRTSSGNTVTLGAGTAFIADSTGNGSHALDSGDNAATEFAGPSTGSAVNIRSFSWWMYQYGAGLNNRWFDGQTPRRVITSRGSLDVAQKCRYYDGSAFVSVGTITYQTWRHYCLCIDDAGGSNKRYYVDGVQQPNPSPNTLPASVGLTGITFGGTAGQTESSMFARLDTVRIYDRAISAAEVLELYNAGRAEEDLGAAPPSNTAPPAVTGSTVVGGTLTTTNGTWTNSPDDYAYEWERSGDGSTGWESVPETNNTYVTDDPADIGYYFRSKVTATNASGSASAYSNVVGPITDVAPTFKPHWALNRSRILGSGIR